VIGQQGEDVTPDLSNKLAIAMHTDPGVVRAHNEDAIWADASLGIVVLADGMGGYNAGEVASGMATTLIASQLTAAIGEQAPQGLEQEPGRELAHRYLLECIGEANASVFRAAESQPQYHGMGTTLGAGMFYDNTLTLAHIGDSRCYRLRGGELLQLTKDHSLLQEQIDSGLLTAEQAKGAAHKNLVTRALGVEELVEIDVFDHEVCTGDLYLLCSDGLNDMVGDEDIKLTLTALAANLDLAATQLVQQANDNGGRDNVSVILVRIDGDFRSPRTWWERFSAWLK
jgi:serine/threonine protein phosphatase PrpC